MDWQPSGIALGEDRVDDVRVLGHRGLRQFLYSRGQLVSVGEGCGIEGLKINVSRKIDFAGNLEAGETTRHETLRNSVEKESLSSHTLP